MSDTLTMRDMTPDQIRAAADFIEDGLDLTPLIDAKIVPVIEQGVDGPDRLIGFESVEEWAEIVDQTTGKVVGYADPCPEED